MAQVQTLADLSSRLFSKPLNLQNLSLDSSPLLNSAVSSLEEDAVQDLLAAELCTTTSDQKQFNEHVSTGSLLHLLAFVGRIDAAEWLLKNGAYVHSRNHAGSTPLHVAAIRHHAEMIRTLRHYHADPYCENKEGKTALDFGQEGDDVKEALLSHRFTGEEFEDEYLQDRLPVLVERVTASNNHGDDLVQSLLCLRAEIRTATSSMTSVPKPLKFLRDKFDLLQEAFGKMPETPALPRALLSDVLSVLALTVEDKENVCLKCRLSGTGEAISSFGHPYISRICTQIPVEWQKESDPKSSLLPLVHSIVVYCLDHSSESEAVDLLMEIDCVSLLKDLVKVDTYRRVCLYLTSCVKYVPEPEDSILLHTALDIYRQFQQYPYALRLAMMLNDVTLVKKIFLSCPDRLVRKQLAFMLGRQQVFLELEEQNEDMDMEKGNEDGGEQMEGMETQEGNGVEDAEDLTEIMSNVHLNNNFLALARELDIMEPKVPEDIYKTHLEHVRFSTAGQVDSAQGNLASSFVNGFVNCGFGVDKLLTEDGNKWIYKNKGAGMLSATASLGLVLLWDVEGGLTEIDKFLYSNEEAIKAGALLACGIVNCGVRNECDPALALLSDYTQHKSNQLRCTALVGMGLAYAGSAREDVLGAISPGIWDEVAGPEVTSLASLSSGLVAVGTGNGELTETLVQAMHEKEPSDMNSTWFRFLALGLALVHLGKQEGANLTKETLNVVKEPLRTFAITLLDICAYTGTGSVLKIQELLHICSESYKLEDEGEEGGKEGEGGGKKSGETDSKAAGKGRDKSDTPTGEAGSLSEPGSHQALAVLGIALIAMGEDIGAEMAHRIYSQLLHYGEPVIRRAVPLALALLSTSHPQLPIIDTLHKFSHDSDPTVARNAIFSMGLVGSGTNNARLAGMLRNLAQFYHKEPSDLFVVRLAQGLTHLGKGTLTLNPYHSDRMLISPVAVAALLIVMVTMLDAGNIILKDSHYVLFYLTPAIQPRMLVTFDEELNPLPVTVRVGQAVDVVGQAGKPKSITGFQTHMTPVLLAYGERAELATEEYIPLTPILEGFVILKQNPDYEQ